MDTIAEETEEHSAAVQPRHDTTLNVTLQEALNQTNGASSTDVNSGTAPAPDNTSATTASAVPIVPGTDVDPPGDVPRQASPNGAERNGANGNDGNSDKAPKRRAIEFVLNDMLLVHDDDDDDVPVVIGDPLQRSFITEFVFLKRDWKKSSTLFTVRDLRVLGFCFKLALEDISVPTDSIKCLFQPEDIFDTISLKRMGNSKMVGILNANTNNYLSVVITDRKLYDHLVKGEVIKKRVHRLIRGSSTLSQWFRQMSRTESGHNVSHIVLKALVKLSILQEVISFTYKPKKEKSIVVRNLSFLCCIAWILVVHLAFLTLMVLSPIVSTHMRLSYCLLVNILTGLTSSIFRLFTNEANSSFQSICKLIMSICCMTSSLALCSEELVEYFKIPTPERVFTFSNKYQDKFAAHSADIVSWVTIVLLLITFFVEHLSIIPGLVFMYRELSLLGMCNQIKLAFKRDFEELKTTGAHQIVPGNPQIPNQEVVNGNYHREGIELEAQVEILPLTCDQLLRLSNCVNQVAESVDHRLFLPKQRLHAPITIIKLASFVAGVGIIIWWYLKP